MSIWPCDWRTCEMRSSHQNVILTLLLWVDIIWVTWTHLFIGVSHKEPQFWYFIYTWYHSFTYCCVFSSLLESIVNWYSFCRFATENKTSISRYLSCASAIWCNHLKLSYRKKEGRKNHLNRIKTNESFDMTHFT